MPTAQAFQQRRWLALTAVVLAQFMVVLDVSIVNVALPSIRNDLRFSLENLQWVLTTSQQIGGAIGLAAATTISITFTDHYLHNHPGTSPLGGAALTHGFQIAFCVLAALVVLAAIAAAAIIESRPSILVDEVDRVEDATRAAQQGLTAADLAVERST
jgi:MFS family permease